MHKKTPLYGQGFDKFLDEESVTHDPNRERYRDQVNYSQKGPQGFRRSDERIHEDICEALSIAAGLDASNIEVQVKNGRVTLIGKVNSSTEKYEAEHTVKNVYGVVDFKNELKIAGNFLIDKFLT